MILSVPDEGYSRISNVLILSVPDEGYSRLSNLLILSVPDEGYSRLSNLLILSVPDEGYSRLFNLLILSVPDEGYSRSAPCALNLVSTFLVLLFVQALSECMRSCQGNQDCQCQRVGIMDKKNNQYIIQYMN